LHAGVKREADVLGHLLALIPGQRAAEMVSEGTDRDRQRVLHVFGEPPRAQVDEQHEPGLPFDQGANRRLGPLAEDQVAFPVARHGAVLDLGWSVADQHHVLQLARARGATAGAPLGAPRPRAPRELLAQRSAPLHKQRLIDRLVRHTHLQIVGIVEDQPCGNLLRGPSPSQSLLHGAPKPRHGDQLRDLRAVRAPVGCLLCAPRPIPLALAGSRDVARHGRRGPTEASCDHPARVARAQPAPDLFPLRE